MCAEGGSDASTRDERPIPHLPALDGLRAIALLSVLCFHTGFSWMQGGYLPLTAFFVLSGFLITALLLSESARTGRVSLRSFWARRARRLVPASLLGLGLVAAYAAFGAPYRPPGLAGDALAALTWVINWRFIVDGSDYADTFADPSPLQHYWSLAVEEQFYLLLPLLAVGTLLLARGRRWLLTAVTAGGIVASTLWMRALHEPGDAPSREYFGTDTRAAELLVGVLLALALVDGGGRLRRFRGGGAVAMDVAGLAALAATALTWTMVDELDPGLYEGGFLLVALLAAVVVAAATQLGGRTGQLLALTPLTWLGRISYGVYLFHWPLFLWIDEEATGLAQWPLFALRMAVTIGLAWLSFHLVEQPIRTGALRPKVALVGWADAAVGVAAVIAVLAVTLPTSGITLRAAGDAPPPPPPPPPPTSVAAAPTVPPSNPTAPPSTDPTAAAAEPTAPVAPSTTAPAPTTSAAPPPLRILVAGDSIAMNLATGLQAWAARTGEAIVYDASRYGCPSLGEAHLRSADGVVFDTDVWCNVWEEQLPEQTRQFRPDVVVVQTGVGDLYDIWNVELGRFVEPGEPQHDQHLLAQYREAVGYLDATGARVLWTTPPCFQAGRAAFWLDQEDDNVAVQHLRSSVVPALVASSSARSADLFGQLCPAGTFQRPLFGLDDARPDGIHLSDVAAERLAEAWLVPLVMEMAGRR